MKGKSKFLNQMNSWSAKFETIFRQQTNSLLNPKSRDAYEERIRRTDIKKILKKTATDLKRLEYEVDNCCTDGVKEPVKLKVTTAQAVSKYMASKRSYKKVGSVRFSNPLASSDDLALYDDGEGENGDNSPPWTTIKIIYGTAVQAYIDTDHKQGPISFKLLGNVPTDLRVYISETFRTVTEENATWTYTFPSFKNFTIFAAKGKFANAYLNFVSKVDDAQFRVQVNFPSQEHHDHRKWQQSQLEPSRDKRLSLDQQEEVAERKFYEIQ